MIPDWRRYRAAVPLALIVLVAFAARLPLLFHYNLGPDAVEYLDIGRNIATGNGFVQTIKMHFFTNAPVIHNAVGERPLGFPLFVALVLRLTDSVPGVQIANTVLGALNVVLLFLLSRRLFNRSVALAAALLAALNPMLVVNSVAPLSEQLFLSTILLTLVLGTLLLKNAMPLSPRVSIAGDQSQAHTDKGDELGASGDDDRPSWPSLTEDEHKYRGKSGPQLLPSDTRREKVLALGVGLSMGLAYLVRPNGILMLLALSICWLVYLRRERLGSLVIIWLAFLAAVVPYLYVNLVANGSPTYSLQQFHYVARAFTDGMWHGYGREFPSAVTFVSQQFRDLVPAVGYQAIGYLSALIGPRGLSFLSGFVLLAVFRRAKHRDERILVPAIALFAILDLAHVSATWATFDGQRLTLPAYALGLVLAFGAISRLDLAPFHLSLRGRRITASIIALVAVFVVVPYLVYDAHLYSERTPISTSTDIADQLSANVLNSEARHLAEYIDKHYGSDAVLAASNPWLFNFLTRRPVVILPAEFHGEKSLETFAKDFHVSLLIVDHSEAGRYFYPSYLPQNSFSELGSLRLVASSPGGQFQAFRLGDVK